MSPCWAELAWCTNCDVFSTELNTEEYSRLAPGPASNVISILIVYIHSITLTCCDPDRVGDPADRQLGAEHGLPAAVEHAGLRPGPHQQARHSAEL